jgi:hypothetical protein
MKTKREILKWWESRTNVLNDRNDYKDFWNKISKDLLVKEEVEEWGDSQHLTITIFSKCWKKPAVLCFHDFESYAIKY